jgi:hypothetical protein
LASSRSLSLNRPTVEVIHYLRSPPTPHLGNHENGENDEAQDWYGQALDASLEHCTHPPEVVVNAAIAQHDQPCVRTTTSILAHR